jgi:hypothetical protein
MNWQTILTMVGLMKGSNVFKTVGNVLHIAGTTVAASDKNDTGNDDLAAGAILALGEGFTKYGEKSSNLQGNIVDALISGLNEYRTEMVRCGKIPVVNQ